MLEHKGNPFNPTNDIPSLAGKVILITGANTGLGKQTALELSKHQPAHIWMASRDVERGNAAVADTRAQAPGVPVSLLELDLASFASIKSAARTFLKASDRLDLLYLNAGIFGVPKGVTEEGYEIRWGVNHVGHALLLKLLTSRLLETTAKGADVRVISVTSHGYKYTDPKGILFDHLKSETDVLTLAQGYTQSKLANLLYVQEIARRHPHFTIAAVTPGDVETELFKREPGDEQIRHMQDNVAPLHWGGVEDGVKNQLWAAVAQGVVSGRYYEPVGVADQEEGFANDREMAERLWYWTQKELDGHDI